MARFFLINLTVILISSFFLGNCDMFGSEEPGKEKPDTTAIVDTLPEEPQYSERELDSLIIMEILDSNSLNFPGINSLIQWKNDRITSLDLDGFVQITTLPASVGGLSQLTKLTISNTNLRQLPESFTSLILLEDLDLSGNQLESLPDSIGNLTELLRLNLSGNNLSQLPASIGNLTRLTDLDVSDNQLYQLGNAIGNLINLLSLNLSHNALPDLPESIGSLEQLGILNLANNQLTSLNKNIINLVSMVSLDLSHNNLRSLPNEIYQMILLRELSVANNIMASLPDSIMGLKGLRVLNASYNSIPILPSAFGKTYELEVVHLQYNKLSKIPKLGSLANLKTLNLSNNYLDSVPASIANAPGLTSLNLSNNRIKFLPAEIIILENLEYLVLDPDICAISKEQQSFLQEYANINASLCEGLPIATVDFLSTNNARPALTGTINPFVFSITLDLDERQYEPELDDSLLTWTITPAVPLEEGVYDIKLTANNGMGMIVPDTTTNELTIDYTAPVYTLDVLTFNDSNPTFTGTVDDTNAVITLEVDSIVYHAIIDSGNTWRVPGDSLPVFMDGAYDITIIAVDSVGNRQGDTIPEGMVIDVMALAVSVDPLLTNDNTPELTGSVNDVSAVLKVDIGTQLEIDATNNKNGTWTIADDVLSFLDEGVHNVIVRVTDFSGNQAYDLTINELKIDNTSPTVTIETLSTSDNTPPLSGTIDDPDAVISLSVDIQTGLSPVNHGNGTWSLPDNTLIPIPDGTYDIIVTVTDEAGNTGQDATDNELTIDTSPPPPWTKSTGFPVFQTQNLQST
ncbi:Ig-like domain-containing protein [Fibrobacterota bacterium]